MTSHREKCSVVTGFCFVFTLAASHPVDSLSEFVGASSAILYCCTFQKGIKINGWWEIER